jgi:hypothetical protein
MLFLVTDDSNQWGLEDGAASSASERAVQLY